MKLALLAFGLFMTAARSEQELPADTTRAFDLLEDFESDEPGELPQKWRYLSGREQEFVPLESALNQNEQVVVKQEGGNKFLRVRTEGEAVRISLPSRAVDWNLSNHPVLQWDWRARHLPTGAREDKVNDSGGAVYVTFSKRDWLGRPLSIKYVYSSALPVDQEVSTGNVKIIVASSGTDGTGHWVHVSRNVVDDYRRVFGDEPPREPFTITLWSDSDNTRSVGEVDFDNLRIAEGR